MQALVAITFVIALAATPAVLYLQITHNEDADNHYSIVSSLNLNAPYSRVKPNIVEDGYLNDIQADLDDAFSRYVQATGVESLCSLRTAMASIPGTYVFGSAIIAALLGEYWSDATTNVVLGGYGDAYAGGAALPRFYNRLSIDSRAVVNVLIASPDSVMLQTYADHALCAAGTNASGSGYTYATLCPLGPYAPADYSIRQAVSTYDLDWIDLPTLKNPSALFNASFAKNPDYYDTCHCGYIGIPDVGIVSMSPANPIIPVDRISAFFSMYAHVPIPGYFKADVSNTAHMSVWNGTHYLFPYKGYTVSKKVAFFIIGGSTTAVFRYHLTTLWRFLVRGFSVYVSDFSVPFCNYVYTMTSSAQNRSSCVSAILRGREPYLGSGNQLIVPSNCSIIDELGEPLCPFYEGIADSVQIINDQSSNWPTQQNYIISSQAC